MPESSICSIPRLRTLDSSASLLLDGYTFGARRFERLGSDAFHTRLMFTPATFMRGEEGSHLFSEGGRFTITGALPRSTLQVTRDGQLRRLRAIFEEEWSNAVADWMFRTSVTLHVELLDVLTRTALRWAGVPFAGTDLDARVGEFGDLIENAGTFGYPNWMARLTRLRTTRWAGNVVREARSGALPIEPGTPLHAIIDHVDANGEPLENATAATELLNALGPTIAVGRFIIFAALALHTNPRWYAHFRSGNMDDLGNTHDLDNFVHEVRRYYPLLPMVARRVRTPFDGMGHRFERHDWVMFDLYGTNHDPRLWQDPGVFRPERFRNWEGNPNTLIPYGGGIAATRHPCPGEPISVDRLTVDPLTVDPLTVDLMRQSVLLLTRGMTYTVADQDLRVSPRRSPAIPEDGFVVRNVSAARVEQL